MRKFSGKYKKVEDFVNGGTGYRFKKVEHISKNAKESIAHDVKDGRVCFVDPEYDYTAFVSAWLPEGQTEFTPYTQGDPTGAVFTVAQYQYLMVLQPMLESTLDLDLEKITQYKDSQKNISFGYFDRDGKLAAFSVTFDKDQPRLWMASVLHNPSADLEERDATVYIANDLPFKDPQNELKASTPADMIADIDSPEIAAIVSQLFSESGEINLKAAAIFKETIEPNRATRPQEVILAYRGKPQGTYKEVETFVQRVFPQFPLGKTDSPEKHKDQIEKDVVKRVSYVDSNKDKSFFIDKWLPTRLDEERRSQVDLERLHPYSQGDPDGAVFSEILFGMSLLPATLVHRGVSEPEAQQRGALLKTIKFGYIDAKGQCAGFSLSYDPEFPDCWIIGFLHNTNASVDERTAGVFISSPLRSIPIPFLDMDSPPSVNDLLGNTESSVDTVAAALENVDSPEIEAMVSQLFLENGEVNLEFTEICDEKITAGKVVKPEMVVSAYQKHLLEKGIANNARALVLAQAEAMYPKKISQLLNELKSLVKQYISNTDGTVIEADDASFPDLSRIESANAGSEELYGCFLILNIIETFEEVSAEASDIESLMGNSQVVLDVLDETARRYAPHVKKFNEVIDRLSAVSISGDVTPCVSPKLLPTLQSREIRLGQISDSRKGFLSRVWNRVKRFFGFGHRPSILAVAVRRKEDIDLFAVLNKNSSGPEEETTAPSTVERREPVESSGSSETSEGGVAVSAPPRTGIASASGVATQRASKRPDDRRSMGALTVPGGPSLLAAPVFRADKGKEPAEFLIDERTGEVITPNPNFEPS